MLSSEFLVDLAEKVYGTLRSLEGTPRPLEGLEGSSRSDMGISVPHILAGVAVTEGKTCTFVETLFELMDARGVDNAGLSARIGWSPEALNALCADRFCCPVKELVFAFGLALELNQDEMRRLAASAGYVLAEDEICDIIVLHCLEKGVFDLGDVNEALKCFNLKPIVIRPLKGLGPAPKDGSA